MHAIIQLRKKKIARCPDLITLTLQLLDLLKFCRIDFYSFLIPMPSFRSWLLYASN